MVISKIKKSKKNCRIYMLCLTAVGSKLLHNSFFNFHLVETIPQFVSKLTIDHTLYQCIGLRTIKKNDSN